MPIMDDITAKAEAGYTHAKELATTLLSDETMRPEDRLMILLLAFCICAEDTGMPSHVAVALTAKAIPIGYLSIMVGKMADAAEKREGK